jgi:hypothetical protein
MVRSLKMIVIAQILLLAVASCKDHKETKQMNIEVKQNHETQEAHETPDSHEYIGYAKMTPDGTLTLYLIGRTKSGMILHAVKSYTKDDPQYEDIKSHVGPIEPGEQKTVRPWTK